MRSYRSPSPNRHRSPSPSSKRRKHNNSSSSSSSHYRDTRSRSRSKDRSYHRHRSHRSSSRRYDDRYDDRHGSSHKSSSHRESRSSGSSSRHHHHDNVSATTDARTHSSSTTSSSSTHKKTENKKPTTDVGAGTPPDTIQAAKPIDKEELARQRKEKIEKWKREQALKKAAEDEAKAKAEEEEEEEKIKQETLTKTEEKTTESNTTPEPSLKQKEKTTPVKEKDISLITTDDIKTTTHEEDIKMKEEEKQVPKEKEEENGKKWSLEDEDEDEEEGETMDFEMSEKARTDAEKSFKPLAKTKEKEDDALVGRPLPQRNLFNKNHNITTTTTTTPANNGLKMKPKTMMRFGMGKGLTMKKRSATVTPMETTPSTPPPKPSEAKSTSMDVDDADVDPLEAYMMDVTAEARKINEEDKKRMEEMKSSAESRPNLDDEEGPQEKEQGDDEYGSDPEDILALAAKKAKKKDLAVVDHSQIEYETFRKNFYIEPPEYKEMTSDQVDMLRIELDGIKIRGVHCPKPIQKWTHCGLPVGCIEVIRKLKFEKPTSIQAQAIPAIMNGRDVIGVAKTGSGKTIAFLLPMFRHIKDQRPLETGEGPIAVIMTPTRELATQIHRECKPFLKVLGLKAVCAYGGSPIKDQIADLKRGCEIIVCTPGRMIDLLCANSGRVTNLQRVTYLVLDEADRMFDMGFEPQVMKIVNNVRPSKQTVLFSATFPRQMEALARKVLKKPLEITVGGRSVVCSDVEQHVEVREDATKFVRLLEILGKFFNDEGDEDSRALIFVDRHEAADNLLRDLIRRGYPCQSLHGGKDQSDRDSTIADFKSGVSNILIATSVAARGLDVKQLKLVVNYECPNHMEDYVHRVGRTGRAGNKGTAYTFITPDQDRYAMDICKALKLSGQEPPANLQALADQFQEKVKEGKERLASSGFGGKGLERLDKDRDLVKRIQKRAYGGEDMEESDEEDIELETRVVSGPGMKDETPPVGTPPTMTNTTTNQVPSPMPTTPTTTTAGGASTTTTATATPVEATNPNDPANAAAEAARKVAARINSELGSNKQRNAQDIVAEINSQFNQNSSGIHQKQQQQPQQQAQAEEKKEERPVYAEEIMINDYPQKARWRVTNKEQISQITEVSGAAITTRGTFFPPGKQPGPNERKLYLFIEGDSQLVVEKAKTEVKRILVDATVAQMEVDARTGGGGAGRYSVV
ncbi:P-loop containing nucleoside triphosphate hydrolase protein [Phascolomyces articulosus]|uniref:RNA helicase n=1 Tax=Phascolomyces articulosus TaxID=60185 RepID=A0AAD5KB17_9FUNG|nr:P-loop containing nucleoside triphosphate hydrolase protein [Phascolomyces articulosus]